MGRPIGRPPAQPEPLTGPQIACVVPKSLGARLDEIAHAANATRSHVIRTAVSEYVERHARTEASAE